MKKHIHIVWLLCILFTAGVTAQNYTQQVTAIQYYFNADPGTGVAGNGAIVPVTPSGNISQSLDIVLPSDLPTGSNQLYIRVRDEWGQWSIAERRSIFVANPTVTQDITAIQYFFDTDPGVGITGNGGIISVPQSSTISQALAVDIPSQLEEGFHNLFIRTKNVTGQWSIAERRSFYLVKPQTGSRITAIQYFFDNDPGTGIAGNGGIIEVQASDTLDGQYNIEIPESLPNGFHHLYMRVRNETGYWSIAERRQIAVGECTQTGLDSLVAWWPFDETSTSAVDDINGNHDGIWVNGGSSSLNASFDGTDDYIGIPDDTLWAFQTKDFTIEFFASFSSLGGDLEHPGNKFIGQSEGPGVSKKWTFAQESSQLFLRLSDGSTSQNLVQFPFSPTLNQWYHLALTRDGDTLRTFIDGQPAGYQVVTGLYIPDVNSPLTVGWVDWVQGGDQGYMHGSLDEMTIHAKALSEAEIGDITEAAIGGKCKTFRIRTTQLSDAKFESPFSKNLETIWGVSPVTWDLISGSLPDGMTLSEEGLLSGVPEEAGAFTFTVQATDNANASAEQTLTLNVLLTMPANEISVFKSGTSVVPGRDIDYFVHVSNNGTATASFDVEEYLEPWFFYASSSPAATVTNSRANVFSSDPLDTVPQTIRWSVTNLEPGESTVLSYQVSLHPTFPLNETVKGGPVCGGDNHKLICLSVYRTCIFQAPSPCDQATWNLTQCIQRNQKCDKDYQDCLNDCGEDDKPAQGPVDPNEKLVLADHYIKPGQLLPFVIHFENIGTIEAMDVFITDTLDMAIDETTLDIISAEGAVFNPETRVLRWNLYDINLLPDSSGYVLYTARARTDLPTGTVIRNRAYIQFEVFDIFATNETENIIDLSNPEGILEPLPDTMYQTSFPIFWSGMDSVGEISRYSVFVATDTGAFVPFFTNTLDTTTYFTGETGKTYHFICIAEDLAGNTEVQAPVAETSTYIDVLCFDRYFPDRDNDGYGDGGYPSHACTQPVGYVVDSTDCNDRNNTIYPGATELCNFLDDDCDGEIDEDRLPVSVTVSASSNPVSAGVQVTFTATPVNGGANPTYQWDVNGNVVAAATGNTYTYMPSNNDTVRCTMTSDQGCTTGNPASAMVVMTVTSNIPMTLTILSTTLGSGTTRCYNATNNINVAYNNGSFVVDSGAQVTLIAGKRINFYPGTIVRPGGYLHAYIAPSGPWCSSSKSTDPDEYEHEDILADQMAGSQPFSLYPNPTRGTFTLRWKGEAEPGEMQVEIYNVHGGKVISVMLESTVSSDFSLEGLPRGLYFVKVVTAGYSGIGKIIRQ